MARSRRGTPSASAVVAVSTAPAGTTRTRATRSRTHEAEAKSTTQPAPRRKGRQTSVESNVSVVSNASRSRRRVAQPQAVEIVDLTTVQERSDEEVLDDAELDEQMRMPEPDEPEARAMPSSQDVQDQSFHTISGTTALSDSPNPDDDSSQDEGADFDVQAFIAYSPTVYTASANLLNLFPADRAFLEQTLKAIDDGSSSAHSVFDEKCEAFYNSLVQLGNPFQEGVFIGPDIVRDKLFAQSMPPRHSDVFHVLELAQLMNLARLAQNIASSSPDADSTYSFVEALDVIFPQPFLSNISMPDNSVRLAGFSFLQDETFNAALALRLQAAALKIQHNFGDDDFDVDEILQLVFFASSDGEDVVRFWKADNLGTGNMGLLPEYETRMRKQIRWLQMCMQDKADALELLAKNFSWNDFRITMMRWTVARTEEIIQSIEADGGIDKLMQDLSKRLGNNFAENPSFEGAATIVGTPSPVKPKRQPLDRSGQQGRQPVAVEPASSPLQSIAGNAARADRSRGNTADFQPLSDFEAGPRASQSMAEEKLQRWQEAEKQKKENVRTAAVSAASKPRAFIDQQADAQRIERFDDDGTQASQRRLAKQSPMIARHQKRRLREIEEVEEEDVSEDEGFQEDARNVDMSQHRREAPLPPPPARARPRSNGPSPAKRARFEDPDEAEEPPPQLVLTQIQANIVSSQAIRMTHQRGRQARRTWSAEEEEYFQDMIARYGTSWSLIKQCDFDDKLNGRDQVALKDKARNMKTSMILAGVRLPKNFENIALDKKAITRLEAAGIYDYDPQIGRCPEN